MSLEETKNGSTAALLRRVEKGQVISGVRAAMALHRNSADAAKVAGINQQAYRALMKLIILKDRSTLPSDDKTKIEWIFERIDRDRLYAPYSKAIDDLISRNWKKLSQGLAISKQDRKRFEATMTNVRETCDCMKEMQLPHDLSVKERTAAIKELACSVAAIGDLIARLTER